jgi:nucleotide-binding universal stress UspA family protein
MKTILVPLDFSETSDNALEYAVGIANELNAKLVLLHTIQMPVASYELEPVALTINSNIEFNTNLLNDKANKILALYPFIAPISSNVEMGDLNNNIKNYVNEKNVDLIVMGITGKSSNISKVVFGSNAISVSKKSEVPVIIVPNNCRYSGIKNIAYACDYKEHLEGSNDLIEIKNIAEIFKALLNVIHIIPDGHLLSEIEVETDDYIESQLENVLHRTFIFPRNNIVNTILSFIKKQKVDLIVMEQANHSFFHELFYPSVTKEIAFSSNVPVMAINIQQ